MNRSTSSDLPKSLQGAVKFILGSAKLAVDETPVPVLDPGRGKTKTGYFWAMAREDRPWGGSPREGGGPPAVAYTYAPGGH